MIPLLAAISLAGGVDSWMSLEEATLQPLVDGDWVTAEGRLEGLIRELAADDPALPRAQLQLANVRLVLDDVDGAREALRDCIRIASPDRSACLAELSAVELDRARLRSLPQKFDFADGRIPVVRPIRGPTDRGSVRIDTESPGGDPALLWLLGVPSGDALLVGFAPTLADLHGVRVRIRAAAPGMRAHLLVTDDLGRAFTALPEEMDLPNSEWATLTVDFDDVVPAAGEDGAFDVKNADTLWIRADAQGDGGSVWIDDLEVY